MRILPREPMQRLQQRFARLYGESVAPRLAQRLALLSGRYGLGLDQMQTPDTPSWDQRDTLLITYGDSLRRPDEAPLHTLRRFLTRHMRDRIRSVHILPFFPYSSDDGFSVIDYRQVNPALGTWDDVEALSEDFDLMFDLVLNHVSRESAWFRDYVNGIAPFRAYFIAVDPDTDLSTVVRPRSSPLLSPTPTPRGQRHVWTTFSADQVDLNFANQDVLFEFLDILLDYVHHGARIVRLDAIAYLWKRIGSPCINLPETHEMVKLMRDVLEMLAPGTRLLTETNLPHEQNISYFGDGDEAHMVYQFSLPPLLLHTFYTGDAGTLSHWARELPAPPPGCTYLNFTASHDGIGVRPLEGLVESAGIANVIEGVRQRGGRVSGRTGSDGTEQVYELNITWFDAMADPAHFDRSCQVERFLCSQTIMLALRGIPAIYLHSLTATPNDQAGVERTGQARSINRRHWDADELEALLADGASSHSRVFHEYLRLLRIRREHAAFHPDGEQRILDLGSACFALLRTAPGDGEPLIAISNISAESVPLLAHELLGQAGPGFADETWRDLISQEITLQPDDGELRLQPNQTLWLSRASLEPSIS